MSTPVNTKPVNQKAWFLILPVFLCVAFSAIVPGSESSHPGSIGKRTPGMLTPSPMSTTVPALAHVAPSTSL